ncbi:MAG: pyridoxamine 5'-phosphate oxidase family protein [Geodermatophilaceae bacterium]
MTDRGSTNDYDLTNHDEAVRHIAKLVDRAQISTEELWSAPLKAWFEDGLDTPGLTLIKVCADTAEYWESPSSKVVKLIGGVRAAVTGDSNTFPGDKQTVSP